MARNAACKLALYCPQPEVSEALCLRLEKSLQYEVSQLSDLKRCPSQLGCSLALLDFPVPELPQAIRHFRKIDPGCKMLAFTPFRDNVSMKRCIDAGADDVLDKPVSFIRLMISIRHLLRLQELEMEVADLRTVVA